MRGSGPGGVEGAVAPSECGGPRGAAGQLHGAVLALALVDALHVAHLGALDQAVAVLDCREQAHHGFGVRGGLTSRLFACCRGTLA